MASLHFQRGKEQIPAKVVHAGDIAAVSKLTATSTGDTFCDKGHPLTIEKPVFPAALYRVAVTPKTQADAAKISPTLTRLSEEDMTLTWQNDHITHETVLQGMGDQHIDVAINRAQNKFQVGLVTHQPKIPYREGITRKAMRNIVIRNNRVVPANSGKSTCALSRFPAPILNSPMNSSA